MVDVKEGRSNKNKMGMEFGWWEWRMEDGRLANC
jgi:hypothetical protein